ncbi:hypothetical protein ACFPM7_08745 [Actinokineospora guangxiensis]|uniref:SH3 domain-containing protein n=1 Tax=Actinokineospora guangxiensis TaxID=1490288 RepID=A0ABW0ENL3_9PSEU
MFSRRFAVRFLSVVFGVAAAFSLQPAMASAQVGGTVGVAAYSDFCATGRVKSIANNLPIRTEPLHSAALITTAQMGYQYDCVVDYYALGDRYTACGVSNANGWILIKFNSTGVIGFTYMTCLQDV